MAVDILSLGFKIDTSPLKTLQRELDNVSKGANKVADDLSKTGDKATKAAKDTSALSTQLKTLAAAYVGFAGVSKLGQTVDDYIRFTAQLKNATNSQRDFAAAYENSFVIAQKAQVEISAVAGTYARLVRATENLGASQQQVSNLTESISLALKVSGASAQESAGAMLQLSQAFGAGALMGEEFRSVAENAPLLLKALSKELRVNVGDLKKMAADGELTAEKLFAAWNNPEFLNSLREQAKNVVTVSGAYQQLKNELTIAIGEFDKASGLSYALASGIKLLAQNLNVLVPLLVGVGTAMTGIYAASVVRGIGSVAAGLSSMVGILASPVGLVALLAAAGTAFAMFHAKAQQGANDALERLRQYREELKKTDETAAFTGLSEEFAEVLKTMDEAIKKSQELQQQLKNPAVSAIASSQVINGISNINDELQKQQDIIAGTVLRYKDLYEKQQGLITQFDKVKETLPTWAKLTGELKLASVAQAEYAKQSKEIAEAGAREGKTAKEIAEAQAALATKLGITKKAKIEANDAAKDLADTYAEVAKAIVAANKPMQSQADKLQEMLDAISRVSPEFKKWAQAEIDYARDTEYLRSLDDRIDAYNTMIDGLRESIAQQQAENAVLNGTANSIAEVTIKRLEERKEMLAGVGASQEVLDQLQREIDLRRELEGEVNRGKALEEYKKAADEQVKAAKDAADEIKKINDRTADNLNRALTDSIMRGFESGKSFAKNFRDSLINYFRTLVLQPIVRFIVDSSGITKVLSSVLGSFGLGEAAQAAGTVGSAASAASAAGSIGGIGDLLGGAKSLFDTAMNGLQGAQNAFANAIGNFGSWVESFGSNVNNDLAFQVGRWININSQFVSEVLPYAGSVVKLLQGDVRGAALTAIGTAIGNQILPGIGGAIGGFLGSLAGGLFGDSPKLYGNISRGRFEGGEFVQGETGNFGRDLQAGKALKSLNKAFGETLGKFLQLFNEDVTFTFQTIFRQRTNVRAWLKVNFGQGLTDVIAEKFNEGGFKAFANAVLGTGLIKAIKQSDAPQGIKDVFNNILKEFNKESKRVKPTANLMNAIASLDAASTGLADKFGLTVEQAVKVGDSMTKTTEELIAFLTQMSQLGLASKTVGQAILEVKDNLNDAFVALGTTMPTSMTMYDALLKGINKNTDDGLKLFEQLLTLRPQFEQFTTAMADLEKGVSQALFQFMTPAQQVGIVYGELANVFGALNLSVPRTVDELIALGESIDYTTEAGLTLAASFPALVNAFLAAEQSAQSALESATNRLATARENLIAGYQTERDRLQGLVDNVSDLRNELKQSIDAQRTALQAIIDQVDSVKNKLQSAIDAEQLRLQGIIDNVGTMTDALRNAFNVRVNGLQETVSKFKEFGTSLKDFRKNLFGRTAGSVNNLTGSRQAFLDIAALAGAGDTEAMAGLVSAAEAYLDASQNFAVDFDSYQASILEVNRILAGVESASEQNVDTAQEQIELLRKQVSAFISFDETIVSVDEAIANLVRSQNEATDAQKELTRINGLEAQYLGAVSESSQSIEQLIKELKTAQQKADSAQAEINRLDAVYMSSIDQSTRTSATILADLLIAQNRAADALERIATIDQQIQGLTETGNTDLDIIKEEYTNAQNDLTNATENLNNIIDNAINNGGQTDTTQTETDAGQAEADRLNAINETNRIIAEAKAAIDSVKKIGTDVVESLSNEALLAISTALANTDVAKWNTGKGKLSREEFVLGYANLAGVSVTEISKFTNKQIEMLAKMSGFTETALELAAQNQFATGGVFTNGIVSRPTAFNMGVMGEAGSEAIMPLTNINGRLGVSTNNTEMVEQLRIISDKISRLESAQIATAQNTGKVAKIIDRADNGESLNVTVVT